ncbi:MAG: asparagine--tRNA ligase [Firmicutes bacterium]|uniref:Asparagine--tRNA ligase n=1 Tax=Sulfobacillus benefaciens TaxID=453960 RepID=A0A2T2WW53_9FIRM|nr:asparagine--tRNA ligase [Bacillota bacterium]PSR26453.1 MAG: asparagine--tRNA ligase [Sulfobacillus benefaciens]
MRKVSINDSAAYVGQQVIIEGWVTHHRSSGKIHFIVVRDGTGVLQCVVKNPDAILEGVEQWSELNQETAVEVMGVLHADNRAPIGVELEVESVRVIGLSENYPIAPKEHGVDFLLDHRHLWIRSPRQTAILRIRAAIVHAIREFLDDHGFIAADPPVITPAAAEGSTTLFSIDYFDEHAYLSQSGQLYLEALAMALGRVYSFGPTFRAEKSKTRRHLMEFWMVEPEMAFCDFEENLAWQEQLVGYVVQYVLETRKQELRTIERDTARLEPVKPPFPRITYDQALERLRGAGFDLEWGEDLGAPHETALAEMFDRPVFVTHYPTALKAFYMQPDSNNPLVALAADLLAPEGYGEIIGGSQRIHDPDLLQERMRRNHLDSDVYGWYIDLRRYGSVPHSGFGMGLERVVAWICGLDHVRETIPFPRTLNRVWP